MDRFSGGEDAPPPKYFAPPPPSQKFKCSFWTTVNKNKNKDFEQNKTKYPNIFHFLEAVCVQISVQVKQCISFHIRNKH